MSENKVCIEEQRTDRVHVRASSVRAHCSLPGSLPSPKTFLISPPAKKSLQEGGSYGAAAEASTAAAAAAAAAENADTGDAEREAELADAKESLRLLQLQTLKFSTLVVVFQARVCSY